MDSRKIIIDILFKNKDEILEVERINEEKIIKLLSEQLMIPAFYFNLKRLKIKNSFSKDFFKYIREIYQINKNRNKELIIEINEICQILDLHNVKYCFLKGAALLKRQIFDDIGERMVGDIDLLISSKDFEKEFLS